MDRSEAERYLASPLARFRPWRDPATGASPQGDLLAGAATHRARVFRGGNQSGKTTVLAVDALGVLLGWHPAPVRFRPPVYAWLSALDWEFGVGQVLWPAVKAMLPAGEVRSIQWYRRGEPEIPGTVTFRNGSRLDFKSAEAGRTKYQGVALHWFGADEEHPPDVIEEARVRLLHHGGLFATTLTPVRRERWVLDLEREPGTLVVRASTRAAAAAGLHDAAALDAFAASLPDAQRRVRMEGDFAALEGLVYPAFARETHVLRPRAGTGQLWTAAGAPRAAWPLPPAWPRFAAIDFGYANPTAVVVAAVEPATGAVVVERCYYAASVRGSVWARLLQAALPPLAAPLVADHDAFERAELAALGVTTQAAVKDVVPGLECVERYLHPRPDGSGPRLYVVVEDARPPVHPLVGRIDAAALVHELEGYRYPPAPRLATASAPRDLPLKRDDHLADALRYLLFFLERSAGGPPRPPPVSGATRDRLAGMAPAAPRR